MYNIAEYFTRSQLVLLNGTCVAKLGDVLQVVPYIYIYITNVEIEIKTSLKFRKARSYDTIRDAILTCAQKLT